MCVNVLRNYHHYYMKKMVKLKSNPKVFVSLIGDVLQTPSAVM